MALPGGVKTVLAMNAMKAHRPCPPGKGRRAVRILYAFPPHDI